MTADPKAVWIGSFPDVRLNSSQKSFVEFGLVPLEVSDSNRKLPPAAMSAEDEAVIPRRNMICSTRLMLNDLWGKTIQGQFATYSRRQPVVDLSVTDISRFHDGKELIGIAPLFTRTVA